METITYSEIFRNFQGEGMYTGSNTVWLRYFGCNLNCHGFGQENPTEPSTYELPYLDFDVSSVGKIEQLPVWNKACDSSYSWSKKYKHLNHSDTAEEVAKKITNILKTPDNPNGSFLNDKSMLETHMCFTGGEPLLQRNQMATIAILSELSRSVGGYLPRTKMRKSSNSPRYVTFETNGTQELSKDFLHYFKIHAAYIRVLFSVSPKLFTVSGENNIKAIKPDVVKQYATAFPSKGQLKFVMGTEDRQWQELDRVVSLYRNVGIDWPVFIMPVGATEEAQHNIAEEVSNMAISKGYHVSHRVHSFVHGNKLGT